MWQQLNSEEESWAVVVCETADSGRRCSTSVIGNSRGQSRHAQPPRGR
jgi:hypothetical protein